MEPGQEVIINKQFAECRPDAPVELHGRHATVIRQIQNGEYLVKLIKRGGRLQYVLPRKALEVV